MAVSTSRCWCSSQCRACNWTATMIRISLVPLTTYWTLSKGKITRSIHSQKATTAITTIISIRYLVQTPMPKLSILSTLIRTLSSMINYWPVSSQQPLARIKMPVYFNYRRQRDSRRTLWWWLVHKRFNSRTCNSQARSRVASSQERAAAIAVVAAAARDRRISSTCHSWDSRQLITTGSMLLRRIISLKWF